MDNIAFTVVKDRNTQIETGTYNIQVHGNGTFGTFYELKPRDLEHLFVFLGDKINEIKGGVNKEAEE